MADEVFRYKDGDRDELVVLFYPGDETIVVNSSSYGEPSRVPLPREEGIKLAHAILAALDASAGVELTPKQLDAMEPGDRVVDCDGDIWTRNSEGVWGCRELGAHTGPSKLVALFGPVRKVG